MRKLPEADRYYLFAFNKKKVHLLYFTGYDYHIACFPTMEIELGSCCDGTQEGITREDAERIDQWYNELTCPTCQKMAAGDDRWRLIA